MSIWPGPCSPCAWSFPFQWIHPNYQQNAQWNTPNPLLVRKECTLLIFKPTPPLPSWYIDLCTNWNICYCCLLVHCSSSLWFPIFWTHFLELDKGFQTDCNHGVNFACLGATARPERYQKSYLPSTWAWPILCLQASTFECSM
jgi:hypothetical protein